MKTCELCGDVIETQWTGAGVTVFVPDGSIFMDDDEYHFHKTCLNATYRDYAPMRLVEIFGFNAKETE